MRILICGSRVGFDVAKVSSFMNYIVSNHPYAVFVHGGAIGVDELADNILRSRGAVVEVYKPDYNRYGRGAPIVRDREMVDKVDMVYAFWNGRSPGTKYVIDYARSTGKVLTIIGV
jgi:hypothetical protein